MTHNFSSSLGDSKDLSISKSKSKRLTFDFNTMDNENGDLDNDKVLVKLTDSIKVLIENYSICDSEFSELLNWNTNSKVKKNGQEDNVMFFKMLRTNIEGGNNDFFNELSNNLKDIKSLVFPEDDKPKKIPGVGLKEKKEIETLKKRIEGYQIFEDSCNQVDLLLKDSNLVIEEKKK